MRRERAFTLCELLVLVAVVGLLVWVAVAGLSCSSLGRAHKLARQATCCANLKTVGAALAEYMSENNGQTPRLCADGDAVEPLSARTHARELWAPVPPGQPAECAKELGAAAMQNVWLMVACGGVGEGNFHCPSDGRWTERPEDVEAFGWTSAKQVSYGLHYPYDTNGGKRNPAPLTDHLNGGVAIMADQNPASLAGSTRGKGVSRRSPVVAPSNHPTDGESVLYMDATVRFYKPSDGPKDSHAGYDRDEIYEPQAGDMPATETDSYVVPTTGN